MSHYSGLQYVSDLTWTVIYCSAIACAALAGLFMAAALWAALS